MRHTLLLAATVALAGTAQAAKQPVYACTEPVAGCEVAFRPATIDFDADGNYQATGPYNNIDEPTRLPWRGWGTRTAEARGEVHIEEAMPLSGGGIYRWTFTLPVRVSAYDLGHAYGHEMYLCERLTFLEEIAPRPALTRCLPGVRS